MSPRGARSGLRLPIGRGGKGSLGFIVIALVLWLVFGINPLTLLGLGDFNQSALAPTQQQGSTPLQNTKDEVDDFVATVLADTEDVWTKIFAANGQTYPKPQLVLFEDRVRSACGFASAASGPFYCPGDNKAYIDLTFFKQLRQKFDAPGDFAQAYVIAHEIGHHVQNVIGVLPRFHAARQNLSKAQANALSVKVELQADCFAGIWAHFSDKAGYLEQGDLQEAFNAAHQIGDDTLQKRAQGYVVPESFNHGTSEQRRFWFERGYQQGTVKACDTFS
jgi:predicted metalloprotease